MPRAPNKMWRIVLQFRIPTRVAASSTTCTVSFSVSTASATVAMIASLWTFSELTGALPSGSIRSAQHSTFSRGTSRVNLATYSVAGRSTTLAGVSDCSITLSFMRAIRSARRSASSKSWMMNKMVFCNRPCRRRNSSCRALRISGSNAENGSSKSQTSGSMARDRAIPTRCRWPPDSCADSSSYARPD